jgi:hypothetical protein
MFFKFQKKKKNTTQNTAINLRHIEVHVYIEYKIKLLTSLALHIVQMIILLVSRLASSNTNYWAT